MYQRMMAGFFLSVGLATGCIAPGPSPITPGNARRHIEPGRTHLAEVVEVFGPPNIVTRRDGTEMWIYDKVSSKQTGGAFGIGGGGAGAGNGGVGGGLLGAGATSSTRSETTVMLIIYFDENDIVRDYRITQTKF